MIDAGAAPRDSDDDDGCASAYTTPRPPSAVKQLADRVLPASAVAKHWTVWAAVSFGLWMLGTALALVLAKLVPAWGSTPIAVLGFGGLGAGLVGGAAWIRKRRIEALTLAREGQLVPGFATYGRSHDTFGDELGEMFAMSLGETRYCITFSIGFIGHEVWVALPEAPAEGERLDVLVQPGTRRALAFDTLGRGYSGDVRRDPA